GVVMTVHMSPTPFTSLHWRPHQVVGAHAMTLPVIKPCSLAHFRLSLQAGTRFIGDLDAKPGLFGSFRRETWGVFVSKNRRQLSYWRNFLAIDGVWAEPPSAMRWPSLGLPVRSHLSYSRNTSPLPELPVCSLMSESTSVNATNLRASSLKTSPNASSSRRPSEAYAYSPIDT